MVNVPDTAASQLVQHALNHLPDPEDGMERCCSTCCAPCDALRVLRLTNQLDDIVRGIPMISRRTLVGYDWWDGDAVDHSWLEARMSDRCSLCVGPPPVTQGKSERG